MAFWAYRKAEAGDIGGFVIKECERDKNKLMIKVVLIRKV
jgi:hypothetical protein